MKSSSSAPHLGAGAKPGRRASADGGKNRRGSVEKGGKGIEKSTSLPAIDPAGGEKRLGNGKVDKKLSMVRWSQVALTESMMLEDSAHQFRVARHGHAWTSPHVKAPVFDFKMTSKFDMQAAGKGDSGVLGPTVDLDEEEEEEEALIPQHVQRISEIYASEQGQAEIEVLLAGHEDVDEEEVLAQEVAKLKTGEDAIAFFARNGSQTKVKFVYCNRNSQQEFAPYDLEVVTEKQTAAEYFTVSATGVVHMCPGQPCEYLSLAEWMHQSLMYSVLTSIAFFKHYLHQKMFSRWRTNARYAVFCHRRKRLSKRLFWAKPLFVAPLASVRSLSYDVECVKVLSFEVNKTYGLDDFTEEQVLRRTSQTALRSDSAPTYGAAKEFEAKHDKVVDILDKLKEEVSRSTELLEPTADANAKLKSMVQEKQEQQEMLRRQRVALRDEQLLGDCIRLADYMFQAALVSVCIGAAKEMQHKMETVLKLFSVVVSFEDEDGTVLTPGKFAFVKMLKDLWKETVQVATAVQQFTSVRTYEQYVTVLHSQSCEQILAENATFQASVAAIEAKMVGDLDKSQQASNDTYNDFREVHDYGIWWSEQGGEEQLINEQTDHETLAAEMRKMDQYTKSVHGMSHTKIQGVISVEAKQLKERLGPIPAAALESMKQLLIGIARDKATSCMKLYSAANTTLADRPKDLDDFAKYNLEYARIFSEVSDMDARRADVDDVYADLRKYGVRVPSNDQIQLDVMHEKAHDFEGKFLINAKVYIEEVKQAQVDACTEEAKQVDAKMAEFAEELMQGIVVDEDSIMDTEDVLEELQRIEEEIKKLSTRSETMTEYNDLFSTEAYEYEHVESTKALFYMKLQLWENIDWFWDRTKKWHGAEFPKDINFDEINKTVATTYKVAHQISKKPDMANDQVVVKFKEMVGEWRAHLPIIMDLGNPAIRPRHWEKIYKAINLPWKGAANLANLTLSALEQNDIYEQKDLVAEMSATASGEFALEQSLNKVAQAWEGLPLPIMNHRNQKDLWILADMSDLITTLEDHTVSIQTMLGSRFIPGIKDQVEVWEHKVNLASDVLDEWLQVQRAWMYLENIFCAEDIQRQLPSEASKFKQVDKFWKETFRKVRQVCKTAMDAFAIPKLLNLLQWANTTLDQIQKSLEDYLETKRSAFPRFYFLSNDELLSILSQTRNPQAVQEHLCKCFDSINRVTFSTATEITALSDMGGEEVPFKETVIATAVVEQWLQHIEHQMVAGLYMSTRRAYEDYVAMDDQVKRKNWLFGPDEADGNTKRGQLPYAAQGALAIDMVFWTLRSEEGLARAEEDPNAIQKVIEYFEAQLQESVQYVRLNLTKLQRTLMGAMIVLDVHNQTVLKDLVAQKVKSTNEFMWSKQLRYYWELERPDEVVADDEEDSGNCRLRQTIAQFWCSYEYLGNGPRLVITPLTDKCYMTLTGAIHLNYGGAPAGPAGTGKTETTKDLGKALQVPVIVFNCSDGLDYKIMGRFFSGLAQAGAWACFDEFNRIQVEVLSVIAQQMLTITHALRSKKEIFDFLGSEIPLNPRFGVFITMNPGYAGRTELPDNLKSLFRPVAMMVPDYKLIAEIILYSEGFSGADNLSRKMVNLYRLSSEQLSKQDHYDFGMRAVKSVLVMAGQLKRANPTLHEDITLIRALRDSNVPKYLAHDLPLFAGIISDLFPGTEVPFVNYGALQSTIEDELVKIKLQKKEEFVGKIIQLLETQLVRHGVMVVGLATTGKTTVQHTLARALTTLKDSGSEDAAHQHVKISSLNPKSVTMNELYGSFNLNTGEWTDGLVAVLVREAAMAGGESKKWVNFDGPVDAVWIENMNTVLDDNKMLCLANGERIKLPPTLTMMFEVGDLAVASPATVSRCGMVYLEFVYLGWRPIVKTWHERTLDELPDFADKLYGWVMSLIEDCIPFIRDECNEAPGVPSLDNSLTMNFLKLLDTYICLRHGLPRISDETKSNKSEEQQEKLVQMYCAYAAIWALGGNIHDSSRTKFQSFIKPKLKAICPILPDHEDLYSISVDDNQCCFVRVHDIVPDFTYDQTLPFFSLIVPTVETTTQQSLLENMSAAGKNSLFLGETGIGKSVGIQAFLNTSGENFTSANANFSAQTTARNVCDIFESRLERKRKTLLGPPAGTRMIIFIDDVNMPELEIYGASPPIELLRQVIDQGGFYDSKKIFFKYVGDTQYIMACGPPGGGKMPVTPRFFRHFVQIWMVSMGEEAMRKIFSSILVGWAGTVRPEISPLASPAVQALSKIFFKISEELLPTPVKCHYTFNLRDPAKVIQGCLQVSVPWMQQRGADYKERFVALFTHEASRQFRDRLIDDVDRDWFDNSLAELIKNELRVDTKPEEFSEVVFGDFFDRAEKPYLLCDNDKLQDQFNDFLEDYNVTYPSTMDLVFFQDAQRHLARVCRVVRQPRGNALLVGVSGVGRKSQARMAAHINEYQCFSIEITRSYGPTEFKEDLKAMMFGVVKSEGKGMSFLFSDTQIVKESFLEDINNILNTGEVPNLMAADEVEQIIGLTRPFAKAAGKPETRDIVWQHFVSMVRNSLHIMLAFSPVGDAFRGRCRQFPSLINCSTIDWYDPWPASALTSVAQRTFTEAPAALGLSELISSLSGMSSKIHVSAAKLGEKMEDALKRKTYTTPTSFLELMKIFFDLLGNLRSKLGTRLDRYTIGGQKLAETQIVVKGLQVEIIDMQPKLAQAAKDTDELMVVCTESKKQAEAKAAECAIEQTAAEKASGEANAIKADCERDLNEALPAFNDAIKALDSLDKKDIQEIKSFAKPPPLVETVLGAVCLLNGRKENWDESKKMMGDSKFLDNLKEYDKDALATNARLTSKLQKYVKREDFTPETVEKVSKAAKSLCLWVRAMDVYGRVSRTIEPKKAKLKTAEDSAATAEAAAAKAAAELRVVQGQVADLEDKLDRAQKKGKQLQDDMELATVRLERAEKLVGGLGAEAIRWENAKVLLNSSIKFLVGDVIIASGFIAYIGPFTSAYREEIVKEWIESVQEFQITADPEWSLAQTLVDPAEIRNWNIHALPSDSLSTDNAIIVTRGRRWPLMIDPQSQANKWVRKMGLDGHSLQVIKLSEPTFLRTLENGIRYGQHVLLENVQEVLDPSLEPVLTKAIVKKGGQLILRLGSEDVPYSEEFGFFITTKLANPHYLPEICIKVTVINFTVTQEGLVDQLTGTTVGHERPDLEETRVKLVVQIAADKAELDRLEQLILKLLAESEGDILADEAVIHALDQSKVTTDGVKERMVVADETMKTIDDARNLYEPVAARAAQLYFVIADMAMIDPMYQWSLSYFIQVFLIRMGASEKNEDVPTRVQLIIDDLTLASYVDICQGLFEDHKLVFSFLVMCSILRAKGRISESGWLYYLRGYQAALGWLAPDFVTPDGPSWLPSDTWKQVVAYAEMCRIENPQAAVREIPQSMLAKSKEWQEFYEDDAMCDQQMPGDFEQSLTPFQRFLVCRTLRENVGLISLKQVVDAEMGQVYVETPPFDLQKTYQNSNAATCLIFILVAGADPTGMLMKLAQDNKYGERLHILSLGQGQGPKAENLIKTGWETGDWVCLQNCHLSASWMPTFERIQEGMKPDQIDESYRLWLTSMPSKTFPVPVLQSGIKMTIEPPKGLKFNLTRSFTDIQPETYESANSFGKGRQFKKLIFALCFFHGVILERRKFGPIGWNIAYEWMQSDLLVSMEQVHMYLEGQEGVPFQTLQYIVAEVNYGGRVTDDKDVRLISAVLARYFSPELLDDAYLLSSLKEYYSPAEGSLDETRAYVKQLPSQENPRVFGLHENALITAQINTVRTFQGTVVDVQPRIASGGGAGKSPEELVAEMVDDFVARIPKVKSERDAHETTYALDSVGAVTSLGVFHKQELERFQILEKAIKSSLKSLGLAIKGLVVMSAALEDMSKNFAIQRVPALWTAKAYPCLKPLNAWVDDLIKRIQFINNWLVDGPPDYFWISSFFFPQGFMTASMQIYARQTRIAIDTLSFMTEVTKLTEEQVEGPPEFGVNVSGLFLQGCGWQANPPPDEAQGEKGQLVESDPGVLFVAMPICWLKPLLLVDVDAMKAKDYACPLYKTSERKGTLSTTGHSTNFIGYWNLPTSETDLGHWVRRGVALLCMLDD